MIHDSEKTDALIYTEGEACVMHAAAEDVMGCGSRCVSSGIFNADDDWDQDYEDDFDDDLAVEEDQPRVKPPKQYKVIVVNDDYTPMEFVVQVLMMFFGMDNARATRVMMAVHTKGKGICGIYSHEIAETKVDQVNEYSRMNQHPLMCIMEEA